MLKLVLLSMTLVLAGARGWAGTDELDQDRSNQSLQGTVVLRVDQRNGQVAMVKLADVVDSQQEAQELSKKEFAAVPNDKVYSELDREAGSSSWYWYYPGYQQGQYAYQGYNGPQNPGQQYPGQQYPNQQYPDQQYPGPGDQYPNQQSPISQYPNQQYPGQQNPGQQYPGQQYPNQQYPVSPDDGSINGQYGSYNQGPYRYGYPYYYRNGNCYNPWYSYAMGPFAYYIYNLYSLFWR